MERKEMKVIDVLRENMKILNELRIPIKEPQIWSAVNGVALNTQLCINAMAQAESALEEMNQNKKEEKKENDERTDV